MKAFILPLGPVNLRTGHCKYFNIYNEWKKGTAEFWAKSYGIDNKWKVIFNAGESTDSIGTTIDFIHDQDNSRMGTWTLIKTIPFTKLKEILNDENLEVRGNNVNGYVYK